MSIIKISQFPTMSVSDVDAPNDLLLITDVSSTQSKTINLDNFGNAITASRAITASYALSSPAVQVSTSSLLTTASAAASTITFTKGDGTTFPITINTGVFPFTGSAIISGSLTVSGSTGEGNINALDVEIDGTSSLRRSNTGNVLYVGNNSNWSEIEYGRNTSTSHKFNSSITASSDISASGDITSDRLILSGSILSKDNSNTKVVFRSNSIDSIVNNYNVIKGDASNGATLGDNTLATTISGATLFIDNLTSLNPSLQALTYDTSSGRVYFTSLSQTTTGSSVVIGDDTKEIDFKATDVKFSTGSTVTAEIDPKTGNAKFGSGSVYISGSDGSISASGEFIAKKVYANFNSSLPQKAGSGFQTAVSASTSPYSSESIAGSHAAVFITEQSATSSNYAGSGSSILISSDSRTSAISSRVQLTALAVENDSAKSDFIVGTAGNTGVVTEKLRVGHEGVIYGQRLRLTSGSNAWLNIDDTFTAALSSSNSAYSPTQAISPNPAVFLTEHSSGPTTFAGSGSAITLVSAAKFANPTLSTKNAQVQLTSIAAINNTHAADFTVGTRTATPANITEKLRITHDGKTIVTGSFHVNNSGSFMTGSTVILENLPTIEPTVSGSLWLSGSGAGSASGSKYLMVFNG